MDIETLNNIKYDVEIGDRDISIAIMSSFVVLTTQYLILVYFNLINSDIGQIVQYISKGIVGILYLRALPTVLKRNKIKLIGIYVIAMIIFLLNFLIFNENWPYLKQLFFPLFFTCLPSFVYAYSIEDWDILLKVMKKAGKITFLIGVILGILVVSNKVDIGRYSMTLSYYMLFPAIMFIHEFWETRKLMSAINFALALLIVLAFGARGPVMCMGVFIMTKIVKDVHYLTYKKVFIYMIVFCIIGTLIINFDLILVETDNVLQKYGIKSRTIKLFLEENLRMSGRDKIYKEILNEIADNSFMGLGLVGDRRILHGRNAYVHNIFIEILVNFGIIIGGLINIVLICLIITTITIRNFKLFNMLIIWLSLGFIHLMVSSSYLIDFRFWIFVGLLCKCLFNPKNI